MNYKLKPGKQLTKEELFETYFESKDLEHKEFLMNYFETIGFNKFGSIENNRLSLILYDDYKFSDCTDSSSLKQKFKKMNFNDWFEEDIEILCDKCLVLHSPQNCPEKTKVNHDSYVEGLGDGMKAQSDNVTVIKNKPEENSFMWAVEQMKQGEKVRRESDINKDFFLFLDNSKVICYKTRTGNEGTTCPINIEELEATDWEIFKENLSDKIHHLVKPQYYEGAIGVVKVNDIQKSIMDFFVWVTTQHAPSLSSSSVAVKVKEIFGESLIKSKNN